MCNTLSHRHFFFFFNFVLRYSPWGGDISLPENLPGGVHSWERFVRLEYFLQYLPEPENYGEAIAYVRSLISNTNVPFGAPYPGGGESYRFSLICGKAGYLSGDAVVANFILELIYL